MIERGLERHEFQGMVRGRPHFEKSFLQMSSEQKMKVFRKKYTEEIPFKCWVRNKIRRTRAWNFSSS